MSLAKILALLLAGLLLISLMVIGLIWFLRNSSSNLVSVGQADYESISVYTFKQAESGYVIVDDPACNWRTDFSQIQHFQLNQDSGWWASLPLSTDDQGRYFCLRLSARWQEVDYIAVGPIDTTPPVLTIQETEDDLVLQMEWLSASEMGLRRHDNHVAVQAARLQAGAGCDKSAWDALSNKLPTYAQPEAPGAPDTGPPQKPAPHPDHFDISQYLLAEPGLTSHYDSSTHLTLAAIPLAEISADTDHCFYVFDTRMRYDGIYLSYP